MLCLSGSDTFSEITSPKSGSRQPESKKHAQGLGIEGHLMNLVPGKAHPCFPVPKKFPELRCYPEITEDTKRTEIQARASLPLSGQWLRFRANGSHGQSCLPRRGQREIQIQGACFPVQRLQPNGTLHLTLYGAGTRPAMDGQWRHFRAHGTLQRGIHGRLGVVGWRYRWRGA